jgi:hypothetical protein
MPKTKNQKNCGFTHFEFAVKMLPAVQEEEEHGAFAQRRAKALSAEMKFIAKVARLLPPSSPTSLPACRLNLLTKPEVLPCRTRARRLKKE